MSDDYWQQLEQAARESNDDDDFLDFYDTGSNGGSWDDVEWQPNETMKTLAASMTAAERDAVLAAAFEKLNEE